MKKIKFFNLFLAIIILFCFSSCLGEDATKEEKSYYVGNSYFSMASYKPYTYTLVDLQAGGTTQEYVVRCGSSCAISLYEYTAKVKLYSSSNALLKEETVFKAKEIQANEEFSFEVKVTKTIQSQVSSVDVLFAGKSHEKPMEIAQKYQVTFVYNNGGSSSKVLVEKGKQWLCLTILGRIIIYLMDGIRILR